jgi:hypothetical protein
MLGVPVDIHVHVHGHVLIDTHEKACVMYFLYVHVHHIVRVSFRVRPVARVQTVPPYGLRFAEIENLDFLESQVKF